MCSVRLWPRIERAGRRPVFGGLLLGGIAIAGQAAAVDGVWNGPGAEWTTGSNWSSTPAVPDNKATFTSNGAPTSVTISNDASINIMQFNAAAPAYTFAVGNLATLTITGGIVNGSAFAPIIINTSGGTVFVNGSSAANASIVNNQAAARLSPMPAARPTPASSTISSASRCSPMPAARATPPSSTTAS